MLKVVFVIAYCVCYMSACQITVSGEQDSLNVVKGYERLESKVDTLTAKLDLILKKINYQDKGKQQNPSPTDPSPTDPSPTDPLPTDAPRPTPAVTVTPPPVDNRPELCFNGYEATIKNTNGEYLFFVKPKHVMMMTAESGLYRTDKTKKVFKKSPRKVDGAFTLPDTNNIYLIKGKKIYEFNSEGARTRVLEIKKEKGRKILPEKTRAAFAVSENQVYMLGDSMVWQLDLSTLTISSESIKLISEEFPGLPSGTEAAMLYDTQTVYFFQSNMYYSFDLQTNTLNGGPCDAAAEFIKNDCEVPE